MDTEQVIIEILVPSEIDSSNRLEKFLELMIVLKSEGLNKGHLTEDFRLSVFNRLFQPSKIDEANRLLESDIIRDLNDAIAVVLPDLPEYIDAQTEQINESLGVIETPVLIENKDLIVSIPESEYPDMEIDHAFLAELGFVE